MLLKCHRNLCVCVCVCFARVEDKPLDGGSPGPSTGLHPRRDRTIPIEGGTHWRAAPQRLNWLPADQGATRRWVPSTHPPSGPGMGPARSMTCRRHHGPQPPLGAVSPIDRNSAPRVLSAQRQGYLGKTAMERS